MLRLATTKRSRHLSLKFEKTILLVISYTFIYFFYKILNFPVKKEPNLANISYRKDLLPFLDIFTLNLTAPWSDVMLSVEFCDSNWGSTGDVHDNPVPAAAAAIHTKIIVIFYLRNAILL